MRWLLAELVVLRDADRERSGTRRDMHAAQQSWSRIDHAVRVKGAGKLDGLDEETVAAIHAQLDGEIERAMVDSVRRAYRRGPRSPRRLTEIMGIAITIAARMRDAARAGLGQLPTGSIDAAWHVLARSVLADHEIGRVFAAAEWLGPGSHDHGKLDRALDAAVRPVVDDQATEAVNLDRRHADVADARWQRLRRAGYRASRNPA